MGKSSVKVVWTAIAAAALAWPAAASADPFSGTRSNISPGGVLGGRCGAGVITVSFAPGAFAASGTSNLGAFSYTASHCIASPPPGNYYDGLFTWDFGDGTLSGTYTGALTAAAQPGQFNVSESLLFTTGTGRFAGLSGSALATGLVSFGQFNGTPASFGDVSFTGSLVPEPAGWAMALAGVAALGGISRVSRRRATA